MRKISITAHAGALKTKPNTLESIRALLAIGVDIIEADIRFLPEGGVPALGHDSVTACSASLESVFRLLQGCETQINLDMKETAHVKNLAGLIAQYGLQSRTFLTGIRESHVSAVQNCGIPYYLNSADIAAARALGALGLNMQHRQCSKKLADAARAQGLLLSVWTVDSRFAMRKMLRMGVDNITTRRPDVLQRIMHHEN